MPGVPGTGADEAPDDVGPRGPAEIPPGREDDWQPPGAEEPPQPEG